MGESSAERTSAARVRWSSKQSEKEKRLRELELVEEEKRKERLEARRKEREQFIYNFIESSLLRVAEASEDENEIELFFRCDDVNEALLVARTLRAQLDPEECSVSFGSKRRFTIARKKCPIDADFEDAKMVARTQFRVKIKWFVFMLLAAFVLSSLCLFAFQTPILAIYLGICASSFVVGQNPVSVAHHLSEEQAKNVTSELGWPCPSTAADAQPLFMSVLFGYCVIWCIYQWIRQHYRCYCAAKVFAKGLARFEPLPYPRPVV